MNNDPIEPRPGRSSSNLMWVLIGLIILAMLIWWFGTRV